MKYSVCNELFGELPLAQACAIIRRAGFDGVEFAPYTVFGDLSSGGINKGVLEVRRVLDGEGLAYAGFHWLMAKPGGLHFAALDPAVRSKSLDHLKRLIDASGRLGGGNLILGSPRQRSGFPGRSARDALGYLEEGLASVADTLSDCSSFLLIEQLSADQTDVVTSFEEAAAMVDRIGSPWVSSMFDFHNAAGLPQRWDEIIGRYASYIRHVHLNEVDGRAPGTGRSDYATAWKALKDSGYSGWGSIEIFEIPPDPKTMLEQSRALFRRLDGEEDTQGRDK
jgi:D-psicose/D-tagatose/L-ribulose 3-epimerase